MRRRSVVLAGLAVAGALVLMGDAVRAADEDDEKKRAWNDVLLEVDGEVASAHARFADRALPDAEPKGAKNARKAEEWKELVGTHRKIVEQVEEKDALIVRLHERIFVKLRKTERAVVAGGGRVSPKELGAFIKGQIKLREGYLAKTVRFLDKVDASPISEADDFAKRLSALEKVHGLVADQVAEKDRHIQKLEASLEQLAEMAKSPD